MKYVKIVFKGLLVQVFICFFMVVSVYGKADEKLYTEALDYFKKRLTQEENNLTADNIIKKGLLDFVSADVDSADAEKMLRAGWEGKRDSEDKKSIFFLVDYHKYIMYKNFQAFLENMLKPIPDALRNDAGELIKNIESKLDQADQFLQENYTVDDIEKYVEKHKKVISAFYMRFWLSEVENLKSLTNPIVSYAYKITLSKLLSDSKKQIFCSQSPQDFLKAVKEIEYGQVLGYLEKLNQRSATKHKRIEEIIDDVFYEHSDLVNEDTKAREVSGEELNKVFEDYYKAFFDENIVSAIQKNYLENLPEPPTESLKARFDALKERSSKNAMEYFEGYLEAKAPSGKTYKEIVASDEVYKKIVDEKFKKDVLKKLRDRLVCIFTRRLRGNSLHASISKKIALQIFDDWKDMSFKGPLDPASRQYGKGIRDEFEKLIQTIPEEPPLFDPSPQSGQKQDKAIQILKYGVPAVLIVALLTVGGYYAYQKWWKRTKKFNSVQEAVKYLQEQAVLYTNKKIDKATYMQRKQDVLAQFGKKQRFQIELAAAVVEFASARSTRSRASTNASVSG